MLAFADGQVDVLVATTVIEVGVDVPNATVMVIMDADRFGVSQLHQLRGRVGRGSDAGLCLLVTEAPEAHRRGSGWTRSPRTLDGFELARLDLEQRREGDVLGAAQAGRRSSLKLLQLARRRGPDRPGRAGGRRAGRRRPGAGRPAGLAAAVRALLDAEQTDVPGESLTVTRIIAGRRRRPPAGHAGRPDHPADQRPDQGGPVRDGDWRSAAGWTGRRSSTCTRARARSASRRCPAARPTCCWSSPTPGRPA